MIRTAIAAASLALLTAATPGFAQDYGYGYRYGYRNSYNSSGYGIVKRDYGSQYSTYHPWAAQTYDSYKPSYGYSRYGYKRY
jgi:hypothetical protein